MCNCVCVWGGGGAEVEENLRSTKQMTHLFVGGGCKTNNKHFQCIWKFDLAALKVDIFKIFALGKHACQHCWPLVHFFMGQSSLALDTRVHHPQALVILWVSRIVRNFETLTLSSPSFFEVSQSKGGGGARRQIPPPPPLSNFLKFNPNLMKLWPIDHWGMLFLFVVVYYI